MTNEEVLDQLSRLEVYFDKKLTDSNSTFDEKFYLKSIQALYFARTELERKENDK